MVEIKGTPVANNNGKGQSPVNSTAELREWCAQQRKFLVAERDTAKTPDAKLIRVGMLRMLNNVENLLIQSSTTFVGQPLPVTFPRSFDELSAVLLDYYGLPRTFPVMDLRNNHWRFQAIKDNPNHKGPILTLNRYIRERDLVNFILQAVHDTFSPSNPLVSTEPDPVPVTPPVVKPAPLVAPSFVEREDPPVEEERGPKRGRKAGKTFSPQFTCPCGRSFRYEKKFKNHQETCPAVKTTPSGRGRKAGETFSEQFACPCGKTFKYKKAYETHQETCQKKV